MRFWFSILMMAAVAATGSGCDLAELASGARFEEEFRHHHDFQAGGRLSVESFNGPINIVGWDRDEVEITGTKHASSEELLAALDVDVVATADFIQVRTVRPSGRRGSMGANIEIRAPRRIALDRIITSNGSVSVSDIEGEARLRTSNGRIRIQGLEGNAEAETSNGGIEVLESSGSARVSTSNGRIKLEGVRGKLEARTSNGGIEARLRDGGDGPITLDTSNGGITLHLDQPPRADITADTSNSSITVHAPADLAVKVEASTNNASIQSDFDVDAGGKQTKTWLTGTINGGGPLLKLSTTNASIRLTKAE